MIPSSALEVLNTHGDRYPHLADDQQTIRLQFSERLWHQLADELLKYSRQQCFFELENDQGLLELYNEMVKDLNTRLNPLKYAQITVLVSAQHQDVEQAIVFLEEARSRIKSHDA